MAWDKFEPEDIDHLSKKLRVLRGDAYACRGQSSAEWEHLTSTLTRAISHRLEVLCTKPRDADAAHKRALIIESSSVEQFQKLAPENLSHTERSMMGALYLTLSLMQHYGTPTRLLDWTMSPWVAAYFASEADLKHDGVIWAFNHDALIREAQKQFGGRFDAISEAADDPTLSSWVKATREPFDGVRVINLYRDNPRMTAQQSLHTMAGTFDKPHDVLIEEMLPTNQRVKIIITANLKAELMRTLAGMNINRYSLFGGAEGVGRLLKDRIQWGEALGLSNVTAPLLLAPSDD